MLSIIHDAENHRYIRVLHTCEHEKMEVVKKTIPMSMFMVDCVQEINSCCSRFTRVALINPHGYLEASETKTSILAALASKMVSQERTALKKQIEKYVKGGKKPNDNIKMMQTLMDNTKARGSDIGEAWKRKKQLIEEAMLAQTKSYCPYSNQAIGCAVLGSNGKVYSAANVECKHVRLSTCAEQVAIGKMISDGCRGIHAVAVASNNNIAPCGACRQLLQEFLVGNFIGDEKQGVLFDYPIFLYDGATNKTIDTNCKALLPAWK